MNLLKLKKLANSGHFDDLAQIWPEALADDDTDRDELLRIVAQVRRLGADEHADKLLSSLLSLHEEEGGKRARLDACRDAAVVMPRSLRVTATIWLNMGFSFRSPGGGSSSVWAPRS